MHGSVENTEILVRLDISNGTVERLVITPITCSIAYRLEEFIKNNKEETKEEKERKQMQTQRQLFEAKVIEFNAKFLKRKEAEKNGGKL